jgi:hypothetical protein
MGSQVLATGCKNTLIYFTIYTPNLQMAVGMSIQQSSYIFRGCYLSSDNCVLGDVVIRKLVCSKFGDLFTFMLPCIVIDLLTNAECTVENS